MQEAREEEVGEGRGNCPGGLSEFQFSYGPPKIKQKLTTRASRMEQFLWQEFFDEYIRHNAATDEIPKNFTEYHEQFCKDPPTEDEEGKQTSLISKYPVYCTTAITLWNHEGDITKTFKRKYSITRPINECSEKFAP